MEGIPATKTFINDQRYNLTTHFQDGMEYRLYIMNLPI